MSKTLISISIPVLNEEENLENLMKRLFDLEAELPGEYDIEFVFTDNCSSDRTWPILLEYAKDKENVKAVRFSKNFGFQRSILTNYLHCEGDVVMQIDADLQDPPEMLFEFLRAWKDGYDIVYGVRIHRKESWLLNFSRKIGYRVINAVSEHDIPLDAGDFRLMDRKVINALLKYRFVKPYIRGTVAGLGFKSLGVPYKRNARNAGESKFNSTRLITLGLEAIFEHSRLPLRFGTYLGFLSICLSLLGTVYYIYLRFNDSNIPEGLASIHILVLFGIGINAFLLGVIGEYLLRIYTLIRHEPMTIAQDSVNITPKI